MAPDRWQRVAELCDSALNLEPVSRSRFLDEACAEDRQLRQEVVALLANEPHAVGFLEIPAVGMAASAFSDQNPAAELLPAGLQVGPYRIVARIGSAAWGRFTGRRTPG